MSNIKEYNTPLDTARELAMYIQQRVEPVPDKFYIAISGGSTPRMLFETLSELTPRVDWKKIQLYWVDERCVPPTDDESNYKMTFNSLLKNVSVPEQNIHRVKGELKPEESLAEYEKEIEQVPVKNGFPLFDLIILGMGEDGHTASIFPTEKELFQSGSATAIGTNPYSNQKRITLTGPTINNAKEIIFHITGKAKGEVLRKILHKSGDYLEYPAAYINTEKTTWYIDKEASASAGR